MSQAEVPSRTPSAVSWEASSLRMLAKASALPSLVEIVGQAFHDAHQADEGERIVSVGAELDGLVDRLERHVDVAGGTEEVPHAIGVSQ